MTLYVFTANGSSAQEFYIYKINDTQAPTISDLEINNLNSSSFTIECDLNDNIGVRDMWIHIFGRGTIPSFWVPVSNGHFSYTFETYKYWGQGTYLIHFYAYDYAGN